MPHHVADPTSSSAQRISRSELSTDPAAEGADTRPGADTPTQGVAGLAQAARRISGLIAAADDDLAAQLDTRQRPRVDSSVVRKVALPPPTVPTPKLESDDQPTPVTSDLHVPRDSDNEVTLPRDKLPPDDR
jgi:hypothetical protein